MTLTSRFIALLNNLPRDLSNCLTLELKAIICGTECKWWHIVWVKSKLMGLSHQTICYLLDTLMFVVLETTLTLIVVSNVINFISNIAFWCSKYTFTFLLCNNTISQQWHSLEPPYNAPQYSAILDITLFFHGTQMIYKNISRGWQTQIHLFSHDMGSVLIYKYGPILTKTFSSDEKTEETSVRETNVSSNLPEIHVFSG